MIFVCGERVETLKRLELGAPVPVSGPVVMTSRFSAGKRLGLARQIIAEDLGRHGLAADEKPALLVRPGVLCDLARRNV